MHTARTIQKLIFNQNIGKLFAFFQMIFFFFHFSKTSIKKMIFKFEVVFHGEFIRFSINTIQMTLCPMFFVYRIVGKCLLRIWNNEIMVQ